MTAPPAPARMHVGRCDVVGLHEHLAARAERAPQAVVRVRREQQDLRILGADEATDGDQQLPDREPELRRTLRLLHRLVQEREMQVPSALFHELAEGDDDDRAGNEQEDQGARVDPCQLDEQEAETRGRDRRDDRDDGGRRQLTDHPLALSDRDREGDEEDAEQRRRDRGGDRCTPAGQAVGIAEPADRVEHEHRDRSRQRELGEIEAKLHRPLAASKRECCPCAAQLGEHERYR